MMLSQCMLRGASGWLGLRLAGGAATLPATSTSTRSWSAACRGVCVDARATAGALWTCRRDIVIGYVENGVKLAAPVTWTDLVGLDTIGTHRIAAGDILGMMDLCAVRAATCHMHGGPAADKVEKLSAATLNVTNTVFSSPILHGDLVRMKGTVVHAGQSSIGVHISINRASPSTHSENFAGESFFTMVAINGELRSAKVVPAVELVESHHIELYERYQLVRKSLRDSHKQAKYLATRTLTSEEVDSRMNRSKSMHIPISSTHAYANRIFLSAHYNMHNTIFGGEIMRWMERHATYCARMFTENRNMYTIGMHSVSFKAPLMAADWVSLTARVVYVRNTTLEVEVSLAVEQKSGAHVTNRATFVIININDIGHKLPITKGIQLKDASQEDLRSFAHAKWLYHHGKRSWRELELKYAQQQDDDS